jgi:phospholipid transport system substrate-binding protein
MNGNLSGPRCHAWSGILVFARSGQIVVFWVRGGISPAQRLTPPQNFRFPRVEYSGASYTGVTIAREATGTEHFGMVDSSTNSRISRRHALWLLGGALFAPGAALAATPETYVQGVAKDVMALASSGLGKKAMRSKFNAVISRYTDIRQIAMRALGPYQKNLKAGDKKEFIDLALAYVSAFFVYYADEFRGAVFTVKSSSTQGKFVTIIGEVQTKGGTSPVRWRIVPAGGNYRLHDVNVRGVWLSLALKDRFTDILKRSKGDFEPLFAELRSAEDW